MRNNFNWNYDTAHACGTSRVYDTKAEALAAARGEPQHDEPLRSTRASEQAHREELAREHSRNPYMLENRYA